MVALASARLVDLDIFEHRTFALEEVNEALAEVGKNPGGFVNIVVRP